MDRGLALPFALQRLTCGFSLLMPGITFSPDMAGYLDRHQFAQLRGGNRIEPDERFVEKKQTRVVKERACQRNFLSIAARECGHPHSGAGGKSELGEHASAPPVDGQKAEQQSHAGRFCRRHSILGARGSSLARRKV